MISQVRIDKCQNHVTIVIKHRYLEPWMIPSGFLHSYGDADSEEEIRMRLGLKKIGYYRYRLSVNYT
jgi:hypothetical protein